MEDIKRSFNSIDASDVLVFFCNGKKITDCNVDPEMTLLTYLRTKLRLKGTKLGCNEGGCGACTVMISYYDIADKAIRHVATNACLAPICAIHGMAITTVEGIGSTKNRLHPVQERLAKAHGTQCGFCSPGIVMSMYALLRNHPQPTMHDITSALEGNLCRCTGYRPILDGFKTFTKEGCCGRKGVNGCCQDNGDRDGNDVSHVPTSLFDPTEFAEYDPSQDIIFPPELMINPIRSKSAKLIGSRVTWYSPVTLDELLDIRTRYPDAKIVAGNTEIGVDVKFKNHLYPVLVSTASIAELHMTRVTNDGITIGAGVTLTRLQDFLTGVIDKEQGYKTRIYVAILEMLRWFAGAQIRNVAAVGGNIVTGSPISDLNPLFMAARASLILTSKTGTRQVVMDNSFFTGYRKNAIQEDEVLVSISIRYSTQNEYFYGYKQAQRREDDIAIVNAGLRVRFEPETNVVEDCSFAFGGMAATTVLATKTANDLMGRIWNDDLLSVSCKSLSEEIPLEPGAPGGMETYRQSLMLSFFFKFYLAVLRELENNSESHVTNMPASFKTATREMEREDLKGTQLCQEVPLGQPSQDAVGRPDMHKSALKHTTGEAIYCDDMPKVEGELYMGVVLSTKASAKIVGIDASAALSLPGVHGYVDADDVPGCNRTGLIKDDEEIFATKEVVCTGQLIGAVVAESKAIAQRAAKLVRIEYEELEPIITLEDAIAKDSVLAPFHTISQGNLDEGFESSDHIVHGEMKITGGQEHFYLETQCCIVIPKGEDGEMEIFCATQSADHVQQSIAKVLGVPSNRIVCRVKRLGGGFGGKETTTNLLASAVAVAANKFSRPVRIMLDRDEDMAMKGTRHPLLGRYKVGCSRDGVIKALELDLYANCGHSIDYSIIVIEKTMFHCTNAYRIPNVTVRPHLMRTNLPTKTSMRAVGIAQVMLIAEHWISDVAISCGISQTRVRELNMLKEGDTTHYNHVLNDCHAQKCWQQCLVKSDHTNRRLQVDNYNRANRWKKRGLAMVPVCFGVSFGSHYLMQAGALVHIYTDGAVLLTHGGVEMGQGLHTKMIQVASRALRIPSSKFYTSEMSTNTVPNASATAASVSSDTNGMAVKRACETLLQRLEPYIYKKPKGSWEDWVKAAYMDRVSLSATGFYKVPDLGYDYATNSGNKYPYHCYGAAVSEVEIDCLTGDHHVRRTDIVMDVGESLNPAVDIGQIEGAFIQGYGLYVLEDHRWTANGNLLTKGPGMYKIPGVGNIPSEFNVSLLKGVPCKNVVYSSKAIGEPPLVLATSVFFAIKDAIYSARQDAGVDGVFSLDAPATADRIRMACVDQFTEQFKEAEPGSYVPFFVRP